MTSYDGKVFYGITADRDLLPDVDLFASCVTEALEELLDRVDHDPRAAWPRRRPASARPPARAPSDAVYLPTTIDALAALLADGRLAGRPDGVVPEGDDEPAEYAALMTAADASAALLAGPGRRVVVVAEVDDPDLPVPMKRVVAVHADPADRAGRRRPRRGPRLVRRPGDRRPPRLSGLGRRAR